MAIEKISRSDSPLLKQFKRFAKYMLNVNPSYVQDPKRLQLYIKGTSWDDDVDVWFYKKSKAIRINYKEKEE